jgi:hypothetical protein
MTIFFIKFFLTVFGVIALSEIAKRVHPAAAGILMGLPLNAAISSFFFHYEQGFVFLMETIPWGIAGLSSTTVFALAYLWMGRLCRNLPRAAQICLTGLFSLCCWGGFGLFLRRVPMNLPAAVCIFVLVTAGNLKILKFFPYQGDKTSNTASSFRIMLFRAAVAGVSISLVTGFANIIGAAWSGIAGNFPAFMFPLLIVLHFEDGWKAYPGIIHAFSRSITNLLLFYLGLRVLLPVLGIYVSYLILYPASALYLWQLDRLRRRRANTVLPRGIGAEIE